MIRYPLVTPHILSVRKLRKLLTVLSIDKLDAGDTRREVADAGMPGLRLVIQPKPSGTKSWCVRYRYGGRPRKLTLGTYPVVDLVKARERAKDALEAIERGEDPAAEMKVAKTIQHAPKADRDAFGVLVRRWLDSYVIPNTRSWWETARLLGLHVVRGETRTKGLPVFREVPGGIVARWAERPVTKIRRRDIHELLDVSKARGGRTVVNRELGTLKRFFNWCVDAEIIETSPAFRLAKPLAEGKRTRILSDTELNLVWRAAEIEGFPFGDIVRLLILTAQRRGEVAGLLRPELDTKAKAWILPPERTKNGLPHLVPLTTTSIAILEGAPKIVGEDHLYGLGGRTPFSGFSRGKARLDERITKLAKADDPRATDMPEWNLHDLRRTVATGMARLGVLPHVVEAVLNHVSGSKAGVAGIYNLWTYETEKREALELWARHVRKIADPPKARGPRRPRGRRISYGVVDPLGSRTAG
ncbi:site-specific integrase [Hyphomicrobium sp. CS1BSMeth3]|uniref:tyrosine-type recombinase/integrase n=1 Tax=Hyphomicrobium sp. CS1BSMeth3 TaxID=1892844 RepID=UPI0009F84591|nr:site-specific integrase [Hyphomicrobium sp. CS1BSMeth3]